MRTLPPPLRTRRTLLVFAATFGLLVAAGAVAMREVRALAWAHQEVPAVHAPDPSWFPVFFGRSTQLDHLVLWNDIGGAIENARKADVVFLGTSQMQFAIPTHEVRVFEKRTGLVAFSLALPFGESQSFAFALMEKFNIRPRLLVINAPAFFRGIESNGALQARNTSAWTARTTVWEERLAGLSWPIASRVFPSFVTPRSPRALLRSSTFGTWMPVHWPHTHLPTPRKSEKIDVEPSAVRRVRNVAAVRGAQLVLTCVPASLYDACARDPMLALARAVGAPVVLPRVDRPLWTGDFVHLCPLSGKRFGRALVRDLVKLDVVRALAREKRTRQPPS